MSHTILVPLDNSEITNELIRIADEWAQRVDGELFFLNVGSVEVDAEKQNEQFAEFLKSRNITAGYRYRYCIGTSYMEILSVEKEIRPNLIIMGAHSHTMAGRLFLGSNTKYVLHHCSCPVYVYKQQKLFFDSKIVVPIDYTDINKPVIEFADAWAQHREAELYFIRVDTYPESEMEYGHPEVVDQAYLKAKKADFEKIRGKISNQEAVLEQYIASCNVKAKYQCVHKFGQPYYEILNLQTFINAELIMMAAHSHTFLGRLFAGSNTDYLLHHAACPMFVYKSMEK